MSPSMRRTQVEQRYRKCSYGASCSRVDETGQRIAMCKCIHGSARRGTACTGIRQNPLRRRMHAYSILYHPLYRPLYRPLDRPLDHTPHRPLEPPAQRRSTHPQHKMRTEFHIRAPPQPHSTEMRPREPQPWELSLILPSAVATRTNRRRSRSAPCLLAHAGARAM